MVWKVIFRIFNSTSKISFPQNKLNDIWFDHIDNHLNRTKPFKMRGNRVYRNNTAIDSFYTYAIVLNGFVPYKVCNTLELHLVKVWRNSSLRAQGNFSVRILQISPYIGDYGSEAAMVIYVVYNEDKLLNPRIEFSPSTDQLNDYFNQGPFYGIYRRNIIQLISNEFLYSFTLNYVLTGKDHFQLRVPLARVWSQLIFNGVGNDSNPMQIYFASPKLVVTTNNLIVSKIRYFTLNNSTPLNPTLVDGPGMKLLQSEGIDVYDKPIRPLMKLEVKKPYVNLRQLRQIQSALVSVWTPKGSANVKIFTKTKEQLINNTGHIHTRLRYFINLEVPLANPDFSLIPDYLDFDANRRLYRLNILNAYKRVEKFDLIIVGLRKAWAAANKDVRLSELHPIIHSWDSNYHMVTWGLVTQIFYTLTIDGIESSLTALSEPALEDYKPALEKEANISLCNCTALRGHSFYLLGSLTSPSLLGQIENVIAIAWKNFNLDFAGNLTAHLRTVDDSFESENKDVSEITYIIVPILDEVIIPDEELEPVTQAILIKTFENYLPTMKILTNIPYKRKDLIFWPIIAVCIIIGSILIMLLLLFVLYGHRKKMEENLITDPKLLKGYNREHFASEPESPREFKNTASLYKDSFKPKRHYSRYGNQIISGSYDINTNSAADMNNLEINSSKLSDKEKHAVKLLPPKDNHSTNIQRENVHTKEEKIDQFITENKAKELKVKEIARSNETDNIVVGCVPGTDVSKLSDSSDSKVAVDNDTSGVDFKKGSKKEMKQKSIKSTAKHVTINLDTPNDIESRDSNMKNEKEKESFPIEIDSKTAYKTDIQLLESSTEKAETHKVNETANQNNVNFENKSSFIDSVNSEQESIETLTTVSSKKVLTFKSEEVDVGDTKAENLDNVLNKDIKIEDNILNGSILNTDDTKRSDESKIQIEGDKKELADETSMVNTFVDIDFKAPNETKTSAETSSRDEDITLNSTTSGEDNQILQGNKSSAVKMSVGLDEKYVNPMITNGIFSDGSIVINDEKNINFENKSSVFHNSSITCLTRELQQPKVNQEIKHTVTVPTNKENELLSKNKLSLENSANLRYSVADNIKTFEEFFSTHKMDKLHYKETTNENKSSQSECLATDDKNQVDQLEELTRESLVDPKANSTTSTEDPVSVRSQVKNGTLEKDEASFIPMSLTTFNGYNKDSDKDVNSNQAFVTIIQVGESNTKTHAK